MNKYFIITIICIIIIGCSTTDYGNTYSGRFIKISISDSNIRKAFAEYSSDYDFDGNGIIVSNIFVDPDTTTCLMMLILQKDFFEQWLKKRKFILYDTIDKRIVIISTLLETFIEFQDQQADTDSILTPYLIPYDGGMYNIWEVEYLITKDTVIKREVKNKLIN